MVDECVELSLLPALRELGHDAVHITELSPSESDEWVLGLSVQRDAVLITADKDFGELVYRNRLSVVGVILLRLHGLEAREKGTLLANCIGAYGDKLIGSFTVVSSRATRSRQL